MLKNKLWFKKQKSKQKDLISISAHQVRNSLSAIKWIMQMFLKGDVGEMNEEQKKLLTKVSENNERALSAINELLFANRSEKIAEQKYLLKNFDLVELIENSIFDFTGEARAKQMEIIFLKPEKLPVIISADQEKIRVVLQNLIENAIKYGNQESKIFICLKINQKNLEFSIKDTGINISSEGAKKIFQKFYRDLEVEKKEITGSGIGLFVSKKIIEDHRGKIWFQNKSDNSVTFYFSLPCVV